MPKSKEIVQLDQALEEIQVAKEKLAKLRKVVSEIKKNKTCTNCEKELQDNTERIEKLASNLEKSIDRKKKN